MNSNKKYISLVTGILIVLAFGTFWLVSSRSKSAETAVSPWDSSRVVENGDTVLVRRDNGIYELNILTKELKPYASPTDDIGTFAGLPKETKNKQISVSMTKILLSQDKTKAVVVFTTFDETKEPSGFDGSLPVLKADEFVCDIKMRKCAPTNVLDSAYRATGQAEWVKYSSLYWYKWDSVKNLLYGYLTGEGVGSASPVYIFNLNNKSLQQTTGYDALNGKEKRAEVPSGAFSPSLNKFVMVAESPNGIPSNAWDLLLYNSDNLSRPAKTFDISAIIDKTGFSRVSSVAWSKDENTIILLTEKQTFTFNLENGEISLKYTDTTQDESGLWLDFNAVNLSASGRFIVFVDYDKTTPSGDNKLKTVLKAIDIKNNNNVIELLREEGLSLDYQM